MARTLWCRWPACLKPTKLLKSWEIPDVCPECQQSAMWTTVDPVGVPTEDCRRIVTTNDRRFLKSLRILVPEDEDDGA